MSQLLPRQFVGGMLVSNPRIAGRTARRAPQSSWSGFFRVVGCALVGLVGSACATSEPLPFPDHHNGFWRVTGEDPETSDLITIIGDVHVHADPDTRRVTVYAQARRDDDVASPAQMGPGECGEDPPGRRECFHPNAVFLDGNGEERLASNGSGGAWWVNNSWVLDGDGYDNCQLGTRAEESYRCIYGEGIADEDGVSMRIGPTVFPLSLVYNTRTPLLDRDPVAMQVVRHDPTGPGFDITYDCVDEASPLNDGVRPCPSNTE